MGPPNLKVPFEEVDGAAAAAAALNQTGKISF
jgi:hypothetical protein